MQVGTKLVRQAAPHDIINKEALCSLAVIVAHTLQTKVHICWLRWWLRRSVTGSITTRTTAVAQAKQGGYDPKAGLHVEVGLLRLLLSLHWCWSLSCRPSGHFHRLDVWLLRFCCHALPGVMVVPTTPIYWHNLQPAQVAVSEGTICVASFACCAPCDVSTVCCLGLLLLRLHACKAQPAARQSTVRDI